VERIQDQRNLTGAPSGAARFNTQAFAYDSLYELSRVDYPLLETGASNHVAYRFDRIGNMLAQTSDLTHAENGRSVADLGNMESGGALGRFNRTGRAPADPPGPYAVTSIGTRQYAYDANGNLTAFDGFICEWDFKNRLAAIENEQMRAVGAPKSTSIKSAKSNGCTTPAN